MLFSANNKENNTVYNINNIINYYIIIHLNKNRITYLIIYCCPVENFVRTKEFSEKKKKERGRN